MDSSNIFYSKSDIIKFRGIGVMKINNFIAEKISKIVPGRIGMFLHFVVLAFIAQGMFKLIYKVMNDFGSKIIFADGEIEKTINMAKTDPSIIFQGKTLGVIIFLAILYLILNLSPIILSFKAREIYMTAKENRHTTFGNARFSRLKEVEKLGLKGNGIIFGKLDKKIISKPPNVEGHTLIVGGTGTGKTRGVVIPTLLSWENSAMVIDIKGELSQKTKAKRNLFGKTYIFNPEDSESDCYDPIKLCNTVDQAQDFARSLIPIPEKTDPFWSQSAQSILSAFVYEGALEGNKLTDIAEKICTTKIEELVEYCRNNKYREVRLLASITYDLPEKTLGGVMGQLKSNLITIATDPNIRSITRQSDWSPSVLEDNSTVYLRISEHLLEQYQPLWTIIINQTLKTLSKREDGKDPAVLIALDEMPRLSKIEGLINGLATLRSRNVHILGVIQSMAQLDSIYGNDERKIIADNCSFKLVLSATDPETQKYFSDLVGQKTALGKGYTIGRGIVPDLSTTEQGTELIRPEDWARLEKIVLLAPKIYPTKLDLAFWDKERILRSIKKY